MDARRRKSTTANVLGKIRNLFSSHHENSQEAERLFDDMRTYSRNPLPLPSGFDREDELLGMAEDSHQAPLDVSPDWEGLIVLHESPAAKKYERK